MSKELSAYLIPVERLDDLWPRILPYIESYVVRSYGRYQSQDIMDAIRDGLFQLWIVTDNINIHAVVMTQRYNFPRLSELQIIMCAGRHRHEWLPLLSKLEDYAKDTGCSRISGIARLGWVRDMKALRYNATHIYLEKDL